MLTADSYVKYPFSYKRVLVLKIYGIAYGSKNYNAEKKKCQDNHWLHHIIAAYSCFMDLL